MEQEIKELINNYITKLNNIASKLKTIPLDNKSSTVLFLDNLDNTLTEIEEIMDKQEYNVENNIDNDIQFENRMKEYPINKEIISKFYPYIMLYKLNLNTK